MYLSTKIYTLAICPLLSIINIYAQNEKITDNTFNIHEIRLSYSDGLALTGENLSVSGMGETITTGKRSDKKSTGIFCLEYRYAVNKRFRFGVDLGLSKITGKITVSPENTPSIKEKELNFLILPTAEFTYIRRHLFQFYSSASVVLCFARHYETEIINTGKDFAQKDSEFKTFLSYQINPIGFRVGNRRIGGFVEVGIGYKAFITTGLSLGLQ